MGRLNSSQGNSEKWKIQVLRERHAGESPTIESDFPIFDGHPLAVQYIGTQRKNYQLFLLDVLAGTITLANKFKTAFLSHKNTLREINQLKTQLDIDMAKQDYESFVLAEIQALDLDNTSYSSLEAQLNFQEKRQELLGICLDLYDFTEHESNASLPGLKANLSKLISHDADFAFLLQYVETIQTSLKEIAYLTAKKIDVYSETNQEDGQLLSSVDDYNRLLNKHRLQNQDELKALKNTLENNRSGIHDLTEKIAQLEALSLETSKTLQSDAKTLNTAREAALQVIHDDFSTNLNSLKLKDAKLTFHLSPIDTLNENGGVEMQLLFSANQGVSPVPIEKAASGESFRG